MIDYKDSKVYEPLPASAVFEGVGFVVALLVIVGWLVL